MNLKNYTPPTRFKSIVCTECTREIKKVQLAKLNQIYEIEDDMSQCLLNQGVICLGFQTRNGCGAPCPSGGFPCFGCRGPTDPYINRVNDLYFFLIRVTSKRTGISEEDLRLGLVENPYIFHTFMLSRLARSKVKQRVI